MSLVPLPSSMTVVAREAAAIVGCGVAQDGPLALGGVVLRQPGDLVEETRAGVVVEPLGRKRARLGAEPSSYVLDQAGFGPVALEQYVDLRTLVFRVAHVAAPSSARRTPESAHRDEWGKKLR